MRKKSNLYFFSFNILSSSLIHYFLNNEEANTMQTHRFIRSLIYIGFLLGNFSIANAEEEGNGLFSMDPEIPIELIGNEAERPYDPSGIWLPEDPVLFKPLIANPREVDYSVGWRFNDRTLDKNIIDVSFGDIITFYRWLNVGPLMGN